MPDPSTAHVAIIGAGPIGIELAVALKKAGVDYLHFDARQVGYTVSWFAPQTRFFSSNQRIAIAGVPLETPDQTKCTREQYLAYLRGVILQFGLKINTYEPVIEVRRDGDFFSLRTRRLSGEAEYRARRIVLATGGTARPRRLNVPGEELPHVSHYFRDPHEYFQRRLLVSGGKNSAVEAVLRCHHCSADVSISYRRDKFDAAAIKYWLMPELNWLIESGRVPAHFSTCPVRITPSHVTLRRGDDTFDVPADFVLALIGYEADMSLCKMLGVQLSPSQQTPQFDARTMETNVRGVYVAGTAVGGTQDQFTVFLENCHIHVDRIVAAITGAALPEEAQAFQRPET